jgi:hypothetical protein
MSSLAPSLETDLCHAKRASDLTSMPVADNPKHNFCHAKRASDLTSRPVADNPKRKRSKLPLALSPAAKIDWMEILGLRRDPTNPWYGTASWQDPEEDVTQDELEAFWCGCSTCLLRDKMHDLVGRDLHIKSRMACELGEMTAHKIVYTQGTRELLSEMREMDEYSCACDSEVLPPRAAENT